MKTSPTTDAAPNITLSAGDRQRFHAAWRVAEQLAFHGRRGATINGRPYSATVLASFSDFLQVLTTPEAKPTPSQQASVLRAETVIGDDRTPEPVAPQIQVGENGEPGE